MPRPPQPLNDDQRRRACALLALGATRSMAAHFADCSLKNLAAEMKRDPAFKFQVKQSELRPEIEIVRTLLEAARDPKQWRAAAWVLERFYPQRYGAQKRNALKQADVQTFMRRRDETLVKELPGFLKRRARQQRKRDTTEQQAAKAAKKSKRDLNTS